jgi:alkanesulfonate monooxygenase SsuD/methylene tetrahydromethanopterin reductase-like flavin-dependent oxidoreductase (luciferase family)
MNIGILMTATAQSGDLAAYARKVESVGFDSFWIPERRDPPQVITGVLSQC